MSKILSRFESLTVTNKKNLSQNVKMAMIMTTTVSVILTVLKKQSFAQKRLAVRLHSALSVSLRGTSATRKDHSPANQTSTDEP